jgi:Flp pilus assembly protein TadG
MKSRGGAIVEAALMMPLLAFLFVGVLDFGYYSYAAICTQNAARAAAMSQAMGGAIDACTAARGELQEVAGMNGVTGCLTYPAAPSNSQPLSVCTATISSTGATPSTCSSETACADCALNSSAASIQATVEFQTIPMIPISGILMGRMNLTRTAQVRLIQ